MELSDIRGRTRLPLETINRIEELCRLGYSQQEIARIVEKTHQTVKNICTRFGFHPLTYALAQHDRDEIVRLRAKGVNMKAIAHYLGLSYYAVRGYMRKENL